jgi:hypothetical protein
MFESIEIDISLRKEAILIHKLVTQLLPFNKPVRSVNRSWEEFLADDLTIVEDLCQ